MSGRLPVPNGGGSQAQNGGPKVSRMQAMQAQFQQKQMAEKETKLLAMLDNQQQRLIQHTNGLLNKYNNNQPNINPPGGPALPPGKVRQMFEERRKGGVLSATTPKGIDKSNPLDPIVTPSLNLTSKSSSSGKPTATAPLRKTASPIPSPAILPNPISRPSNLGSSKKPTPPPPTISSPHSSSSSKPVTPTSLPPSRGSGGGVILGSSTSRSSSGSSTTRSSPSSAYPPIANTTKYSDYASELDRREATLSNKLRGMDISGDKIKTTTKSTSSSVRTTPSPSPMPVAARPAPKPSKPSAASRPKGSPPPGMAECKICGRYFAPDRITKHETICKKVTTKKRKVFDPTKMRMQGTEAEPYIRIVSAKPKVLPKASAAQGKKKLDWRKKHEEFIATIRAAKEYQAHVAKGGNPNDLPPPPPSDNSDYVQCPHCGRKFSEGAAERHIPKCKNIKSNKR